MIKLFFLNKIALKLKILRRIINVLMIYLVYLTFPKYTYFFSTRKLYPNQSDRWIKNKFKPYIILNNKRKKKLDNVNLVAKGQSFNLNDLKKFKDPTFLVGFSRTLRVKNNNIVHYLNQFDFRYIKNTSESMKLFQKKNFYYINYNPLLATDMHKNDKVLFIQTLLKDSFSNKEFWYGAYKSNKNVKILKKFKSIKKIKIIENIYKNYYINKHFFAPTGSVIPAVYYLLSISKKVNIYGWDFYFDKKIKNYNYFSFLKKIYRFKLDVNRSWNHIESCLMNLYFAYILEKKKNIFLHGNLSQLYIFKKFIKKFEKVIFKC